MPQIVEAALTWTGLRFEPELQIEVGDDGTIAGVAKAIGQATVSLADRAILPGFVNAHSHSFQRGLRGRGENFPQGAGSFWSWREAMYSLVESLDEQSFYDLTFAAYREMLAAGITTVGEFHYLPQFDQVVFDAARDAGIRVVLLKTYYRTGGIGRQLAGAQRRFETAGVEAFWQRYDELAKLGEVGCVAHSIRAVPLDDLAALHRGARERGAVFHMHVEEQQQEIDDCVAAYGFTPMRLILDRLQPGSEFTAVHATRTSAGELSEFLSRGGNVCVTPLTEANLGDGVPQAAPLAAASGQTSLGTDSNARISMIEEMRWLEYAQRLLSSTRGIFRNDDGRVAPRLIDAATSAGARSLGMRCGRIESGALADLVAIDLTRPALAGSSGDTLAEALVFGAGDDAIAEVAVGGRWVSR
jgi:formiminoglutamate deiminase